jgi:hypothetical protein
MDESQLALKLTNDICAWLREIVGAVALRIDRESVIGGSGVRLSLGEYLSILEKAAVTCEIDVAVLLQLQPPLTVGALARSAAGAATTARQLPARRLPARRLPARQ